MRLLHPAHILACLFALCLSRVAVAQAIPPFSSVEAHQYDSINLATLGIELNVPVRSKAGHTPFSFSLKGTSQIVQTILGSGPSLSASPSLIGGEPALGGSAYIVSVKPIGPGCSLDYWVYYDHEGNSHAVGPTYNNSACGPTSWSGYTGDGSGYYVTVPGNLSWDVYGNESTHSVNESLTDPNGNSITSVANQNLTAWTLTDTLGQVALTKTNSTSPAETDTWTDALGNSRSASLYTTPYTELTSFGCGGEDGASRPNTGFPTSISFPDGSSMSFGWETNYSNSNDYTGRIASITLPTGGTITYTYSGGTHGINCADGSGATMTRTTPDGTWTYVHALLTDTQSGGSSTSTTVTDPQGNNTVYTFGRPYFSPTIQPSPGFEGERQVYNGAVSPSNLVETVLTCYNPGSSPTNCPLPGGPPIEEKDVYTTYTGLSGYAAVKTAYNYTGQITDVKTYDFGATSPTNEKQIKYGSGNPATQSCSAITNPRIIAKPCSVTLLDSQNNNAILSQTWFAYDSNGNLIQTWELVSGSGASGTYLSKQYTYNSHGVAQTMTDVNGQVINYTTTSCNNMFVTSQYPSNFTNLQTSQTWDCNGGVVTSNTDANGQTTEDLFSTGSSADPFYRVLESKDELGNTTSFTYTPKTTESVLPVNGGSSVVDTLSTTDSTGRSSISQLRQGPGSTSWDTKSRNFDGDGRTHQTTLACVNNASAGCATAEQTQTYDGLNRPLLHTGAGGDVVTKSYNANDVLTTLTPAPSGEHAKSTQKEYDGLGRLKSVCVISSASGSGSCGQTTGATGFLTRNTYDASGRLLTVVENAQSSTQQTRSYTYDLLGRVLSEANPESGTTHYTYDSVSGTNCTASSTGDLVQEIDANGNTVCYHYDGLHRKTSITYAGPNSNGTNKYFVYDSATVDGTAMTYAEGRLAEEYTCSGSCTSKITDEGFSYDQRGLLKVYYQSSPNSGGYYVLSASYWEDRQLETVSGLGLPTLTYGTLDGEARVTTVSASSGTNPVSGVVYNNSNTGEPIGALTTVTVGTGDTQNFTYDPNTARMTSYSASVGATPQVISGTLNWNANGTLLSNTISDAYNSADTQNCTYAYDDFMRAASVSCVNGSTNVWNQNFMYGSDAFGNLTKSVPTGGIGDSWPPSGGGYNASTNQYTGITGVTYDADGDLLTDTFHTYTWLADGHVASVATGTSTTSIVYDAEGNKVEENGGSGGSLHEYVSAFGISAQMTGQTETSATVNLPGGVEALYSLDLLVRFQFPDWQGSIRAESSLSRAFTESVAFAPFGERYAVKGAPFNVDSFTGKPDQIASDEYDFEARELHDGQGRWISPDPMKGTGNKYAYADNNPLSNVDLYGFIVLTSQVEQNPDIVDQQFQNLSSGAESHPPDPEQTGAGGCMTCTEQTNQGQAGDAPQQAQTAQPHNKLNLPDYSISGLDAQLALSHPDWADAAGTVLNVGAQIGFMALTDGASEVPEVLEGGADLLQASTSSAAAGRALDLAGTMGKTQDFVTIAVTQTKEDVTIVSSSENAVRPAVRAALKEGEVAVKGAGHAEVTGVNAARQMGLTPTGVAASRGICPSCAEFLKDAGVAALSILKSGLP